MSAKNYSVFLFLAVALVVLGVVGQAQAFSPSSAAGLQAWLNPSATANITLSGSNVTDFIDSANATDWVSRGAGSSGPTYSATAINGQPGILYSGNNKCCFDNNASILNLAATNTTMDFFAVVSVNTTSGTTLWSTDKGDTSIWNGVQVSHNGTGNVGFYVKPPDHWYDTTSAQVPTNNTAFILELVQNGAAQTVSMYKNGTLIGSVFTGAVSSWTPSNYIATGGQCVNGPTTWTSAQTFANTTTGYNFFQGAEGDMIWYNTVLSRGTDGFSGDAGNVGYYLQQKYGITGAYEATSVPEPSTLALLAAGLAALLCYAWRKRR
jgi:hypothetical protein